MVKDTINRTEGLRRQAQEIIEQAYCRGYKDGEADAEERHKEPSVVTMNLEVDKERFRKAMEEVELTLVPAEPRKGEWIISSDGYYPYCSKCHYRPHEMTNYCPNCGAKMEE